MAVRRQRRSGKARRGRPAHRDVPPWGPHPGPARERTGGLPVIGIVSLGCAKNTVDSERVLGMLADRGFPVAADPADADVVLVNTCSFIAPAREETEAVLRSLADELGPAKPVVAIGCYAETLVGGGGTKGAPGRIEPVPLAGAVGSQAFACGAFGHVAAFVPFGAYGDLPGICSALAGGSPGGAPPGICPGRGSRPFEAEPRLRIGWPATAYLKIAEGCSNRCSYCAVPGIRGGLRSFEMEALVDEAGRLADLGARELCVVAQDTASYGVDLYGGPRLAELLARLCGVEGLLWVRLLYLHPAHLTDEVLEVMSGERKLVRYLDLPCQHASDRVLAAMGRRHDGAELRRLIAHVRERLPGTALRTSIIVGFPGETEEDFRQLLDFVGDVEFDHLGAFVYSPEEGTAAAAMPGRVPAKTAAARRSRLMRAQQRIAFARLDARLGSAETAMLGLPASAERDAARRGGRARPGGSVWLARTAREAPEVDGEILVEAAPDEDARGETWRPGVLAEVRIVRRAGYDLVALPEEQAPTRAGPKAASPGLPASTGPPAAARGDRPGEAGS